MQMYINGLAANFFGPPSIVTHSHPLKLIRKWREVNGGNLVNANAAWELGQQYRSPSLSFLVLGGCNNTLDDGFVGRSMASPWIPKFVLGIFI